MDASTLRDFLRSFPAELTPLRLAMGLLLALTALPASVAAVEPSTGHDVVIVGAGAAGMYELLRTILPAAANISPTPCTSEISAPSTWAGAIPLICRTPSYNAYMPKAEKVTR